MTQTENHRRHREGTENTESHLALRAFVGGTLSRFPQAGRDANPAQRAPVKSNDRTYSVSN